MGGRGLRERGKIGEVEEGKSTQASNSKTAYVGHAGRTDKSLTRSFPCSTSLHIARSKELEAASRSSKTYDGGRLRTVEEDLRQFNLGLASEHKTEQLGGHSQEQQRHRQAPIDEAVETSNLVG